MKPTMKTAVLLIIMTFACLLTSCISTEVDTVDIAAGVDHGEKGNNVDKIILDQDKVINQTPDKEHTFRKIGTDINTLNSNRIYYKQELEIVANTIEGLFTYIDGYTVGNGVCESYEVSEDGQEYIFHLRKDSEWSNGDHVTAYDFDYAWRALLDPKNYSSHIWQMKYAKFKGASEIDLMNYDHYPDEVGFEVLDDYALRVELEEPNPYLLSLLAQPCFAPMNQKFVESKGEDYGSSMETYLSNGPYILSEWKKNEQYVLTKNPKYYDHENVTLEKIIYKIVDDGADVVKMYDAGELDYLDLNRALADQCSGHPDYKDVSSSGAQYVILNTHNEILKNVNARKAFAYGFDKTFIAEEAWFDRGTKLDYIVPYETFYDSKGNDYRTESRDESVYNVKKAKAYWAKAKSELQLDSYELYFVVSSIEPDIKTAEYVKKELEANLEGLTIIVSPTSMKSDMKSFDIAKKSAMTTSWWLPDFYDPLTYMERWGTEGFGTRFKYSNSEFDGIMESLRSVELTTDMDARWRALKQAEKLLLEDEACVIPVRQSEDHLLVKPEFQDVVKVPISDYYLYKNVTINRKPL